MESAIKELEFSHEGDRKILEQAGQSVIQLRADNLSDTDPLSIFWKKRAKNRTGWTLRRYPKGGRTTLRHITNPVYLIVRFQYVSTFFSRESEPAIAEIGNLLTSEQYMEIKILFFYQSRVTGYASKASSELTIATSSTIA